MVGLGKLDKRMPLVTRDNLFRRFARRNAHHVHVELIDRAIDLEPGFAMQQDPIRPGRAGPEFDDDVGQLLR